MMGMVPHKKNGCTEVGARIIAKVSHVTCMLECSRRYGSASKTQILIGAVFKISGDKLPSVYLCINVHVQFDLGGEHIKISKVNLRFHSLAPGPVFTSDFIHPMLFLHI